MFIFETKYLLWSIILLISDIIVTIFYNKFEKSKFVEKKIINFFYETLFFVSFRIIWIYRNVKYIGYFYLTEADGSLSIGFWLLLFSTIEFGYEILLILMYLYHACFFKEIYDEMTEFASNCSLKLFLQINKLGKIETTKSSILYISSEKERAKLNGYYEERYKKRKIKLNPISLIIACSIINRDIKIENKENKINKQKEFDEKFYKMVISDFEKIKKESLEKSTKYFEEVKYKSGD